MAATVLFTGGNGFIGSSFASFLFNRGFDIVFYTKNPNLVPREYRTITNLQEIEMLPTIDAVVNLAGAPVMKKWTKEYQQEIYDSRIATTLDLISSLRKFQRIPKTFISASSIGYYLGQELKCYEDTPVPETGNFCNRLCSAWEDSAKSLLGDDTRLCFARFGVVLAPKGGILKRIENQFRLGLGTVFGKGTHTMSWVHLEDCINALWHILQNDELNGPFNVVAPKSCSYEEFYDLLAMQFAKKPPIHLPEWLVSLIFVQMGKEMLLKGVNVIPNRLQQSGFFFKYPDISGALQSFYA